MHLFHGVKNYTVKHFVNKLKIRQILRYFSQYDIIINFVKIVPKSSDLGGFLFQRIEFCKVCFDAKL